jgi:hypothetical protein
MSCPETKTRTTRGAIVTTHACSVKDAAGREIDDFTKLADGATFTAVPKWVTKAHDTITNTYFLGKKGPGWIQDFSVEGKIPSGSARLASNAPALAEDATPAERLAFMTAGGSRDVFTSLSNSQLRARLRAMSDEEMRAAVAWCTPADLEVLSTHPELLSRVDPENSPHDNLTYDIVRVRTELHGADKLAMDKDVQQASHHIADQVASYRQDAARVTHCVENMNYLVASITNASRDGLDETSSRRLFELASTAKETAARAAALSEVLRNTQKSTEWLASHRASTIGHDPESRKASTREYERLVGEFMTPLSASITEAASLAGEIENVSLTIVHRGPLADNTWELRELATRVAALSNLSAATSRELPERMEEAVHEFLPFRFRSAGKGHYSKWQDTKAAEQEKALVHAIMYGVDLNASPSSRRPRPGSQP